MTEIKDQNNKAKSAEGQSKPKKSSIITDEKYEEVYNELCSRYPKLFIKEQLRLLKIGIRQEIAADYSLTVTKTQLGKFLKVYCSSANYRKLHIEGAKRYDLEGSEAGVITLEDIEGLAKQKEKMKKAWKEKKQKHKASDKSKKNDSGKRVGPNNYKKTNSDTLSSGNKEINHVNNRPKLGIKLGHKNQ